MKILPKDKFDVEAVEKLKQLDEREIIKLIPEMFLWIADGNWPVAIPMIEVLVKYPKYIMDELMLHLSIEEQDDELKYFIITLLIPRLPSVYQEKLLPHIKRIYYSPSMSEKSGSYEAAEGYLGI